MERVGPNKLDALIAQAKQHDESALTELLRVHSHRLLQSVRAELGDRMRQRLESQDVMQQVYLDALRNIDQFVDRGHDSFFAWLRRIAVNRICDVNRKAFQAAKRAGELRTADLGSDDSVIHLLDTLAGSSTTPSVGAERVDQIRLLRRALDQLNDDQCQVIRLRYLNQLDVAETATKMDRSERAIRSLCVRALIRLRELLGDAI